MNSGFTYRVGSIRGWASILAVLVLLNLAFVVLIEATRLDLLVQNWFLTSWIVRPGVLEEIVISSGWPATLLVVFYVAAANALACALVGLAIYHLRIEYMRWRRKRSEYVERNFGVIEIRDQITPNSRPNIKVISSPTGCPRMTGLFPQFSFRLPRASLGHELSDDAEPIERLEYALLQIMNAAPETPADIVGYHGTVSLLDHSERVAARLEELSGQHRLARTIGLAHDIGKLLTYRLEVSPNGTKAWVKRASNHDSMGANLVRSLPEYHALDPADQHSVNIILSFTHNPREIPHKSSDPEQRALLHDLKTADGEITAQDRKTVDAQASSADTPEQVKQALRSALDALNINQCLDDSVAPDGYASPEQSFIAVKESALRRKALGLLSPETERTMALRAKHHPGRNHPSVPAVARLLDEYGLLLRNFRGTVSRDGLFRLQVAGADRHSVWLIDRAALSEWLPQRSATWGRWNERTRVLPVGEKAA